ncbi:MAG TPA: M48 family metalloprotease, partial [Thermoanaerobaculia bacterium]|nr:M48 family metalloprotease [Thermoanaerobaculia bacterium]
MEPATTASSLGVPAAAVATFLALTVGLLLLAGRRAARAEGDARTAGWFGFWRVYRLCVEGSWVLWLAIAVGLSLGGQLAAALPALPRGLLVIAVTFVPPIAVGFAGHLVARRVLARLHAVEVTAREAALEAAGRLLARGAPAVFLLAAAWSLLDDRAAGSPALWVLAAFASPIVAGVLLRRAAIVAEPLGEGELRDRAFELAQRGGVALRQVLVLPARRTRMANAFAHFRGVVMLTDHLVERLGRREVDAVLAHELGHLRHRHLRVRAYLLVPVFLGVGVLAGLLEVATQLASAWLGAEWLRAWGAGLTMAICIAAVLALYYLLSRRNERDADAASAEITQDPEAMISALGRLSRLGLMPTTWGAVTETFTTHPSMLRRAQALAIRFGLPLERMRALLETGIGDEDHYAIPPAGGGADTRLYTAAWKQAASLRVGMTSMLAATGVLVAAGVGVQRSELGCGATALVYLVAFALALLLTLELQNLLAAWGYEALRRRLAAGLPVDAAAAVARGEGWFVGLGPSSGPRYYDGHSNWDVGHVLLAGDSLVYLGDGTAFALPRARIAGVRLGPGPPGWLRVPNAYVDWRDDDG